jgi:hypothetical protein
MKLTNRLFPLVLLAALTATGCKDTATVERPRLLSVEAAAEPARFMPARFEVVCPDAHADAVRID